MVIHRVSMRSCFVYCLVFIQTLMNASLALIIVLHRTMRYVWILKGLLIVSAPKDSQGRQMKVLSVKVCINLITTVYVNRWSFNQWPDINECKDPRFNNCSHACHNTIGSYNCLCPSEHVLNNDGVTCNSMLILFLVYWFNCHIHIVSNGVLGGSIIGGLGILAVMVVALIILVYTCPKCSQKLKTFKNKTKYNAK